MGAASDVVKKSLAESVVAPKRLGNPAEFGLFCTQIIENAYINGEVIRLDVRDTSCCASKLIVVFQ